MSKYNRPSLARIFAIAGFVLLITLPGFASNNFSSTAKRTSSIAIEPPLSAPTVGEKLVFDVIWMGVPIGTGTLEVSEKTVIHGRPAYHVIATAQTNDFLSALCPVRDRVESYFDAETGYSLEFRKQLQEGGYRADEHIIFDAQKGVGIYESLLNKSRKEVPISGPVHDIISAFYRFRQQPFALGHDWRAVINSEEKSWDLEMKVLRAEVKVFRKGPSVDTLVVEPKTRYKGVLYKRGRSWVNFSVDRTRRPVWITMQTPFGPVIGVLRN